MRRKRIRKRQITAPVIKDTICVAAALMAAALMIIFTTQGTSSKFILSSPAENWREKITSSFGQRQNPLDQSEEIHKGIDIGLAEGTQIFAAASGTVSVKKLSQSGYGFHIIIEHAGGYQTLYAHCSHLLKQEGEKVKQGEVIALSGSTGQSTGSHLHFEVRKNGEAVNPLNYLSE